MKTAVVLASGASSRFWPLNARHKTLAKIMGKPLIYYTIKGLEDSGIKEVFISQNERKDIEEELKNYKFSKIKIRYFIQKEPRGMGDALLKVRNLIKEKFFVVNAERVDVKEIIEKLKFERERKIVLFGQKTQAPHLYGVYKIKKGKVIEIVEKPKRGKEPSDIRVLGVYLLSPEIFNYYPKTQTEYSFEKALSNCLKKVSHKLVILNKERKLFSLKYPWHLFEIKNYLMEKYLNFKVSKKAEIGKNAFISGKVFIKDGVKIFENAVIKGPCYIGENSIVGNNVIIRESTNLEKDTLVGAGAEIKNCIFEEGVHCHSGFFGDSVFGKNTKIGAGTITANLRIDRKEIEVVVKGEKIKTGLKFLGSIIGENTKVGINSSLMPGVLIGSNCIIGPHSLVKRNIKDNTLFYSRYQEIEKRHRF
jgi:UDP-N-acetylglucosamine diphosphorylase/glucosamine-1-phosphate N-acetyltransferase